MERVKRYTEYYFIIVANGTARAFTDIETNKDADIERFNNGNYFANKNDAIEMANKIEQLFIYNKNK